MDSELVSTILEIVLSAVALFAAFGLRKLGSFLQAKRDEAKENTIAHVMLSSLERLRIEIDEAVGAAAAQMNAKLEAAKQPGSPGGTKVTKEELDAIKKDAVSYAKSGLGTDWMRRATNVLGITQRDLDEKIERMVESRVSGTVRPDHLDLK